MKFSLLFVLLTLVLVEESLAVDSCSSLQYDFITAQCSTNPKSPKYNRILQPGFNARLKPEDLNLTRTDDTIELKSKFLASMIIPMKKGGGNVAGTWRVAFDANGTLISNGNDLFQCLRCDSQEEALVTKDSLQSKEPMTFTFVPATSAVTSQQLVLDVLVLQKVNESGYYQTGRIRCEFGVPCVTIEGLR